MEVEKTKHRVCEGEVDLYRKTEVKGCLGVYGNEGQGWKSVDRFQVCWKNGRTLKS